MTQKKLAFVISSFSTLLEVDIKKYDDFYLTPIQLFLDEEQWLEGFYNEKIKYEIVEKFQKSNNFKTSLAPIGMLEEQMKRLSEEYEHVIYLPINGYLSSSHDALLNLSKNYKNVHVVDNKIVGHSYIDIALEAKKRFEKDNYTIKQTIELIKWFDQRCIGYIIPYELKTFIKSGRLKGIKKTIMSSLKLSTIVEFDYELNSIGITPSKKLGAQKVIKRIENFIKSKKMKIEDFSFSIIYAFDKTISNVFEETVKKELKRKIDHVYESSLGTMFHTGFGAAFLGIAPKIKIAPNLKK